MKVLLPNNDLALWHVNFLGAKGTLYEGENFTLQLRFSNDYVLPLLMQPIESPEVIFIGHIPVHEHIYSNGFICLSILYDGTILPTQSGLPHLQSPPSASPSYRCLVALRKRSSLRMTRNL